MEKITKEEFEKALNIVRKYDLQQQPDTVCVSITYDAKISRTLNVPAEWSNDDIQKNLKHGYHHYNFKFENEECIDFVKITELIVDGDYVKLTKI